jgi:hypothetical protein
MLINAGTRDQAVIDNRKYALAPDPFLVFAQNACITDDGCLVLIKAVLMDLSKIGEVLPVKVVET